MIFRKKIIPGSFIDGLGQTIQVCPNLWIESEEILYYNNFISIGSRT
ncbi:MAG: hypothetical protein ACFFD2_00705 [Promethearchaeota archaeon]